MVEPEPGAASPRIVAEGDVGLQRWIYTKATAKAAPTLTGRHLLLKARKLRLPLSIELVQLFKRFGEVENITLAKSGAFLYITYNESSAAKAAREALSEDTAASVMLGCGNRCRGATVHFCTARDLYAEAAAQAALATQRLPDGLHLLDDFLDPMEEQRIIELLQHINWGTNAGHRRVAHFGHTFSYTSRSVNYIAETPALPEWTTPLLSRLREQVTALPGLSEWVQPDQLTVNEYQPGQGIAAHVETHSAFEDVLLGISLQSGVTMDFRNCELRATRNAQMPEVAEQATENVSYAPGLSDGGDKSQEMEACSVWLPPRSLLVLSGTVRYGWSHGIAHRRTEQRNCATQPRGRRYSLTFRKVRPRGNGCRCQFARCCDARSVRTASVGRHGQDDRMLQREYVEQPAMALLTQSCERRRMLDDAKLEHSQARDHRTRSRDALLPPEAIRAAASSSALMAKHIGPTFDCAKISEWVSCTCGYGAGGTSGALVAVLGSCYGGILGLDERTPVASGGYGWLGCHPVLSYLKQLSSGSDVQPSRSAVVTASFALGPVEAESSPGQANTEAMQSPPFLPIRSNSCDAVVVLGVLDQLSTVMLRERCVMEALRLLRPPQDCSVGGGGEACFEVVAAPPSQRALTHDCAADLLVPVHIPSAHEGAGGSSCEVFFHTFAAGELEKLVKSCASRIVPELEVEILWSAMQREGSTHACAVRRVR